MDQHINEKISWKNILLAFGITAVGVINYREYNILKKIYKAVNSEQSIPSKSDSVIIEKIRSEAIEKIQKSNLFNKFNKKFIIDSISVIDIRVVDSIDFTRESSGCYINIKKVKELKKNILLDVPSKDNFIIIERSALNSKIAAETISHEIYHYFDKLLGSNDVKYSNNINLDKFTDKKVSDYKYSIGKIEAFIGSPPDSSNINRYKLLLDEIYKQIKSDKEYYTNPNEMFSRYKTLKDDMIRLGIIKDINSKVTIEEIATLFDKYSVSDRLNVLPYIFYLDLSKLEELDKVL